MRHTSVSGLPEELPQFLDEAQRNLPATDHAPQNLGLTFRDSKKLPVHGWYPYVEGFSARYIEDLVRLYSQGRTVYDPFGGSGTVNLVASSLGVPSTFSEANPFMRFVAETKVNARHRARLRLTEFELCVSRFKAWANSPDFDRASRDQDLTDYMTAFGGKDFFGEKDIRDLQAMRDAARSIGADNPDFRDLLLLAIASVTVACSHMTRRADLRRRRTDEYRGRIVNVRNAVIDKLSAIQADVGLSSVRYAPASFVSADCRQRVDHLRGEVELILTSPPYLNGTSYIRNTKLELWLMGFILSERDLTTLNRTCMVCGINNVIKGRPAEHQFDGVETVAAELEKVSPDVRIPELVRGYFSDMLRILQNCAHYLRSDGRLVLDIGDSQFYGVHVPTDALLVEVAKKAGLCLVEDRLLARRHSRDKTPLRQVELTFSHAQ
ncbi:restriction endonuclease [Sinorhizobium meliloti]|uniref:restriction endonuclease n=1 Tax=Rhizobium meliloti TaxID=382 RepID=UPI001297ECAA|nr:restriction endonuclease [Sinorhizobium meliloti]MQV32036.1 restriction endonuclease [Sinorhizobium meliloti]